MTLMQTDLDLLSQRVEKAAAVIQQLRDERKALAAERETLHARLQEVEQKVHGHDVPALLAELQQLRKEQRDWQAERRDVANRVEALLKKLDVLEA